MSTCNKTIPKKWFAHWVVLPMIIFGFMGALGQAGKAIVFALFSFETIVDHLDPDDILHIKILPKHQTFIFHSLQKRGKDVAAPSTVLRKNETIDHPPDNIHTKVVIVTPERSLDLIDNDQVFNLSKCKYLLLDEADRMLDNGFILTTQGIEKYCGNTDKKEMVLFSATWPMEVNKSAKGLINLRRRCF